MRLIDADALCENLSRKRLSENLIDSYVNSKRESEMMRFCNSVIDTVLNIINVQQSVDAEPVRYGKWEHAFLLFSCSVCDSTWEEERVCSGDFTY